MQGKYKKLMIDQQLGYIVLCAIIGIGLALFAAAVLVHWIEYTNSDSRIAVVAVAFVGVVAAAVGLLLGIRQVRRRKRSNENTLIKAAARKTRPTRRHGG